jgi:hypothetical protein
MPLGPSPEASKSHGFGAGSLGRHIPISWVLLQELPVIWYNKPHTISTSDPRRPAMSDPHTFTWRHFKVLDARHATLPRVITADKNAAYPPAFEALQHDPILPEIFQLRQCKFLNNLVEQDYRLVKRRVNPGLGFRAFATAQRTIQGYEAMHMLRKGQIEGTAKRDVLAQNRVIDRLVGLAA